MARTKRSDGTLARQEICQMDDESCTDPAEQLFRNQKIAFLEALLEMTPLSRTDKGFLLAYFEYGPGGSGIVDGHDFGFMFGMNQGMVVFHLHSLLERLERRIRFLGYRKIDFC